MPITAQQLENVANAALDFYIKDKALTQTIQDRPLLNALIAAKKTFPGGKESIRFNVKGEYLTQFMGYSGDDQVSYGNPANLKQVNYAWKEQHAGINVTLTELKNDGISVVDSMNGKTTSNHSDRELTAITNLFEDKLDDMDEGTQRSLNLTVQRDGTQDPKVPPGLQYLIADDPTTGIVGGLDRAVFPWWRNRSRVGANKIVSSPANQTLSTFLRQERRQLMRFGGKPTLLMAGSTFLSLLEAEVAAKGLYTQTGFSGKATDITVEGLALNGLGTIQYDPTLDDLGRSDFLYAIDPRYLQIYAMDGEWMKTHAPARPPEKYVLYRALTITWALVAKRMNVHGVYQAA